MQKQIRMERILFLLGCSFILHMQGWAEAPPSVEEVELRVPPEGVVKKELNDYPYKTWMITDTPRQFLSSYATSQGFLVYQCTADPTEKELLRSICWIDLKEAEPKEHILHVPKGYEDQPVLRGIDGEWILFYTEGRIVFKVANLRTGEEVFVGRITLGKQVDNPVGPFGAIAGGKVVWVDEYDDKTGRRNAVKEFDLKSRTTKTLFEAPVVHEIDHVAVEGNRVVYSLVNLKDRKTLGVDSDIYLYDIDKKKHTRLSKTKFASQPEIHWPYVVWKTGIHFVGGGIYVYNAETKQGKEIKEVEDSKIPLRYHTYQFPYISEHGVTWSAVGRGEVEVYSPKDKKMKVKLYKESVCMYISGKYIAWITHGEKSCPHNEKLGCIMVTDLSKPTTSRKNFAMTFSTPK